MSPPLLPEGEEYSKEELLHLGSNEMQELPEVDNNSNFINWSGRNISWKTYSDSVFVF